MCESSKYFKESPTIIVTITDALLNYTFEVGVPVPPVYPEGFGLMDLWSLCLIKVQLYLGQQKKV